MRSARLLETPLIFREGMMGAGVRSTEGNKNDQDEKKTKSEIEKGEE